MALIVSRGLSNSLPSIVARELSATCDPDSGSRSGLAVWRVEGMYTGDLGGTTFRRCRRSGVALAVSGGEAAELPPLYGGEVGIPSSALPELAMPPRMLSPLALMLPRLCERSS